MFADIAITLIYIAGTALALLGVVELFMGFYATWYITVFGTIGIVGIWMLFTQMYIDDIKK